MKLKNENLLNKVLIFGWAGFLGTVICREMPALREALIGTFGTAVAVCVGGFITTTIFLLNYVDSIHQKLCDFVEKADNDKFQKAQTSLTKLKREIYQNMCFFTVVGISVVFVKATKPSMISSLLQTISVLLLSYAAIDQARAVYTCIGLRELVIRPK